MAKKKPVVKLPLANGRKRDPATPRTVSNPYPTGRKKGVAPRLSDGKTYPVEVRRVEEQE